MSKKLTILSSIAIILSLFLAGAFAADEENQNFDSAAAATAGGWHSVGSPSWGFSNTSKAGGPAGEGGGTMNYTKTGPKYYGDDDLGGALTEADAFSASGTIYMECDVPRVGYFDTTDPTHRTDFTGFQPINTHVLNYAGAQMALFLDGLNVAQSANAPWLASWTPRWWWFSYDGAGNIQGQVADNSSFTGTEGVNVITLSGSKTVDLDFDLDGFGLPQNGNNRNENRGTMYIDNLSYTIVPEPATVAILGLGSLVLLRRRRG